MAQWMGQYSGQTHSSRVEDREKQLRHSIAVLRAAVSDDEKQEQLEVVKTLAERLLRARLQATKAYIASLDPRDDEAKERAQRKLMGLRTVATHDTLIEFNVPKISTDSSSK